MGEDSENARGGEPFHLSGKVLQALFDSVNDAIFVLDGKGNFLDVNKAAHERLGYTRAEMLKMNVSEIDPPDFADKVPERMREIADQGQSVFESAHVRKDGTVMPVEVSARSVTLEGRRMIFSVIRDITARKAMEERLRASEGKARLLFDSMNDAIYLHDLDGGFIDVNRAAHERLGYSRGELLSMKVSQVDTPESAARIPGKIKRLMERGEVVFESVHRRKDGSVLPVEVSGRLVEMEGKKAILSIARDVTERQEAERRLRESEEKYSTLFQHSHDAIFLHGLDGEVLDANRRSLDMLGYSHEELCAMKVMDLHPEEALPVTKRAFEEVSTKGAASFEIPFKRKDGTVFPGEISASLFLWRGRKVVLGAMRDITERKETELAIAEYTEELVKVNHLKQLFADILSHDLMNPATIVMEVANLLAGKEAGGESPEVGMIRRNAGRIVRLIRDASTYARVEGVEALEEKERDLGEALSSRLEALIPRFEKRAVSVETVLREGALVLANPLLDEVFENLLDNASKFAPEGSKVRVLLEGEGDRWVVTVEDEGEGVADMYKETIFERFNRREKRGVRGSGLGLAIARRVTELHGGEVWVEDNPGGGSRFKVSLPKAGLPPPELDATAAVGA